jgi:hypothetical protein
MTGCARDEIVDDSEPEREEWRRERKKVSPRATHKLATTREVIELTDDESEGGYLQPSNIIDISGSAIIGQLCFVYLHLKCQIAPLTPALAKFYQVLCLLQRTIHIA